MIKKLLLALVVLGALASAYLWLALKWSFSDGERAGWVQKFSHKGWICKTWEGELALVSTPGAATEKFFFTVHDDVLAREISRSVGKRVALHYEEKVGLPTTCFGETRHFVKAMTLTEEIPLSPGVVVPTPAAGAPAAPALPPAATVPAAPVATSPAAPPAVPSAVPPTAVPAAPAAPAAPASR